MQGASSGCSDRACFLSDFSDTRIGCACRRFKVRQRPDDPLKPCAETFKSVRWDDRGAGFLPISGGAVTDPNRPSSRKEDLWGTEKAASRLIGGLVRPRSSDAAHRYRQCPKTMTGRCDPNNLHAPTPFAMADAEHYPLDPKKLNWLTSLACKAVRVAASLPAGTATSAASVAGTPDKISTREAS